MRQIFIIACGLLMSATTTGALAATINANLLIQNMLIQPDRKIVVTGQRVLCKGTRRSGNEPEPVIARLTADGHLDPTFGQGGYVSAKGLNSTTTELVVRSDGKFWLDLQTRSGVGVTLLNADGSVDSSTPPKILFATDPSHEVFDLTLKLLSQTDDKGLAVISKEGATYLLRFHADASPDLGFGEKGLLQVVPPDPEGRLGSIPTINLPNGNILTQYFTIVLNPKFTFNTVMKRFDAQGQLDRSFGEQGSMGFADRIQTALVGLQNGNIITMQQTLAGTAGEVIVLDAHGRVDPNVGRYGHIPLPNPSPNTLKSSAAAALEQPDGKVVIWAQALTSDSRDKSLPYLLRILPNGTPDPSFGRHGRVSLSLMPNRAENPIAMGLDAAGRVIVASTMTDEGCNATHPFLLQRVLPDGHLDLSFGDHGVAMP